mmetsp:Transcript_21052/g.47722  ORF Transcript_21052/g.47722 Transcript_21052/m.47722 type:complete len:384 (-) Transcript_21052:498-1649(-)
MFLVFFGTSDSGQIATFDDPLRNILQGILEGVGVESEADLISLEARRLLQPLLESFCGHGHRVQYLADLRSEFHRIRSSVRFDVQSHRGGLPSRKHRGGGGAVIDGDVSDGPAVERHRLNFGRRRDFGISATLKNTDASYGAHVVSPILQPNFQPDDASAVGSEIHFVQPFGERLASQKAIGDADPAPEFGLEHRVSAAEISSVAFSFVGFVVLGHHPRRHDESFESAENGGDAFRGIFLSGRSCWSHGGFIDVKTVQEGENVTGGRCFRSEGRQHIIDRQYRCLGRLLFLRRIGTFRIIVVVVAVIRGTIRICHRFYFCKARGSSIPRRFKTNVEQVVVAAIFFVHLILLLAARRLGAVGVRVGVGVGVVVGVGVGIATILL